MGQDPLRHPSGSPAESGPESASTSHLRPWEGGTCWDQPPLPWRWALGETRSLGRAAIGTAAWVELFVGTCVFLSPDVLPAIFPRGCLSPSDCHTDTSASQVLGRAGAPGASRCLTCLLLGSMPRHPATKATVRGPRPALCTTTCLSRSRPSPLPWRQPPPASSACPLAPFPPVPSASLSLLGKNILWRSTFVVQLSHPNVTTGKTVALTRQTLVGKATAVQQDLVYPISVAFDL